MEELREYVTDIKPDIIALTEIKPKNNRYTVTKSEISIEGYISYASNISRENGRGVIIYILQDLQSMEVNFKTNFEESIWASIKLSNSDELLIGCIYRSSSMPQENNDKLCELMKESCSSYRKKQILIVGDFNYRTINWPLLATAGKTTASNEQNLLETVKDCYLTQHVTEPTRGRGLDKQSLLDLIFTNDCNNVNNLTTLSPIGKSDHCVLTFDLVCQPEKNDTSLPSRNFRKANYPKIMHM